MYTFREAYMQEINVKEMRSNLSALLNGSSAVKKLSLPATGKKLPG